MEKFSFKITAGNTYHVTAASRHLAMQLANEYVAKHHPESECVSWGWVASTDGPNIFRMSVGS
jgi:hypothetical protein